MVGVYEGRYEAIAYINGVSRNKTITAKVSQQDLERIESIVKSVGLSRSAFIREAVMTVISFLENNGCGIMEDDNCTSMEVLKNFCKKIYNK